MSATDTSFSEEKRKMAGMDATDRLMIDNAMRVIVDRLERCGYKHLISGWRIETPKGRVYTLKMKSYAKKGSEAERIEQAEYAIAMLECDEAEL